MLAKTSLLDSISHACQSGSNLLVRRVIRRCAVGYADVGITCTNAEICSPTRASGCMTRSSPTYNDMIYADTPEEVQKRRKAFLRKWRLRHPAVANSLQAAGDRLFTFTTLPPSQWKSTRSTNAIDRLHEELKRRIKTQTVLPSAETAAMLFWALPASGQISMRKVDGWKTLSEKSSASSAQLVDLAA
jgi:Transposase, Mutator family